VLSCWLGRIDSRPVTRESGLSTIVAFTDFHAPSVVLYVHVIPVNAVAARPCETQPNLIEGAVFLGAQLLYHWGPLNALAR
jgi:hypothetical protein